jgi:uncharacterized protein (TIGR00251 family)
VVERCHFAVRITPKASKNAINGWRKDVDGADYLTVSVTAVPENGKANEALIKFLSKDWKIPKSEIIVERGHTDRNKILSIPKEYEQVLKTDDV